MGIQADLYAALREVDRLVQSIPLTREHHPQVEAVLAEALTWRRRAGNDRGRLGERLDQARTAIVKFREFEAMAANPTLHAGPARVGASVRRRGP